MERDGTRWNAMERDGALALDCIPSQAEYVVLSPENAMVSEHQTSGEAVRAFAQYVLETGKQVDLQKGVQTVGDFLDSTPGASA